MKDRRYLVCPGRYPQPERRLAGVVAVHVDGSQRGLAPVHRRHAEGAGTRWGRRCQGTRGLHTHPRASRPCAGRAGRRAKPGPGPAATGCSDWHGEARAGLVRGGDGSWPGGGSAGRGAARLRRGRAGVNPPEQCEHDARRQQDGQRRHGQGGKDAAARALPATPADRAGGRRQRIRKRLRIQRRRGGLPAVARVRLLWLEPGFFRGSGVVIGHPGPRGVLAGGRLRRSLEIRLERGLRLTCDGQRRRPVLRGRREPDRPEPRAGHRRQGRRCEPPWCAGRGGKRRSASGRPAEVMCAPDQPGADVLSGSHQTSRSLLPGQQVSSASRCW